MTTRGAPAWLPATLLTLAMSPGASADDGIATTISGYGTVGGTSTSNGNYAYTHDSSEFSGAAKHLDVGLESRIGVQAVFDFGSDFSITAQEVARRRGDQDFDPGTEWLYAQYTPSKDWMFRFGRVVLPTFLLSDSREVGYAAVWFRAPNEIYASEPFNYVDGGQVQWHRSFGSSGLSLQSSYGQTKQLNQAQDGQRVEFNANYVFNVSAVVEYDDLLVRVAETRTKAPVALSPSPASLLQYNLEDKYLSVGTQYDDGKAVVLGEWARRSESNAPDLSIPLLASTQWYVAGGWRLGKLTPMLIYGQYAPAQSLLFAAGHYHTWSAALRYDMVRNVALKAQVSRPQAANGYYWATTDGNPTGRVSVYSLGVDFLF